MSETHRDYFNNLACEWNQKMPADASFKDLLLEFGIRKGEAILDIGAGTGRMTQYITELAGGKGTVVAEDIAINMLLHGKLYLNRRVQWLCDSVIQLALKNATFHKILCFSAFPHFQNQLAALNEMHRVLKSGGELLILHLCSSDQLNEFHASLEGTISRDRLLPAQNLATLCKQTGFEIVRIEENEHRYWVQGRKPIG